jgi:hypothetical protein
VSHNSFSKDIISSLEKMFTFLELQNYFSYQLKFKVELINHHNSKTKTKKKMIAAKTFNPLDHIFQVSVRVFSIPLSEQRRSKVFDYIQGSSCMLGYNKILFYSLEMPIHYIYIYIYIYSYIQI